MLIFIFILAALTSSIFIWFLQKWFVMASQRYREAFQTQAQLQLNEFFLFLDPKQLWGMQISLCILLMLGAALFSNTLLIVLMAGISGLSLPIFLLKYLKKKRAYKFDHQLPDMLQSLASALKAGSGIQNALKILSKESPAPLSQEFSLILREQRIGISFEESLDLLYKRMPTEACALVISALKVSMQSGGNLAETLERIAQTLRTKQRIQGRINALTAQGKMQAWIMSLLPVFIGFVLFLLDPDSIELLWTSTLGWVFVLIIITLEIIGIWMILKIVNIDI